MIRGKDQAKSSLRMESGLAISRAISQMGMEFGRGLMAKGSKVFGKMAVMPRRRDSDS